MQLARWLGLCAVVGGTGVVFIEPILGWEEISAWSDTTADLRIMGGAVALVGMFALIVGNFEDDEAQPRKEPSVPLVNNGSQEREKRTSHPVRTDQIGRDVR